MQSIPPPAEDRAVCASHPHIGAAFTCERCGGFGCESCRSTSRPTVCQTCSLRVTSAPRDDGLTVGALLGDSFRLVPRNLPGLGLLLGGELVAALLLQLVEHPERHGFFLFVARSCLSALGTAAFLSWTRAELLQEPERSPFSALHVGLFRFPALVLMNLLFGIVVGMGAVLLLLPGLYLAVRMSLASPLLVLEGRGPLQALNDSYSLTRKHGWTLLGVLAVMVPLSLGCSVIGEAALSILSEVFGDVGAGVRSLGLLVGSGVEALGLALLYTPLLLAWMRISQSLSSSTPVTP